MADSGDGPRITVVLAEGNTRVRAALRRIIESERGFAIVGEAVAREACEASMADLKPDALVVGAGMLEPDGLERLPRLHALSPETRIVVTSLHWDPGYTAAVKRRGGAAHVRTDTATSDLLPSITGPRAVV